MAVLFWCYFCFFVVFWRLSFCLFIIIILILSNLQVIKFRLNVNPKTFPTINLFFLNKNYKIRAVISLFSLNLPLIHGSLLLSLLVLPTTVIEIINYFFDSFNFVSSSVCVSNLWGDTIAYYLLGLSERIGCKNRKWCESIEAASSICCKTKG